MDDKSKILNLKNICSDGDLSVRANNVCHYNKLETLAELIAHRRRYGDFTNLPGCGRKSNNELIGLCNKYEKTVQIEEISKIAISAGIGKQYGRGDIEVNVKSEATKVSEILVHELQRKERIAKYFAIGPNMDETLRENLILLQSEITGLVNNLSPKAYQVLGVQLNNDFSTSNFYFQFHIVQESKFRHLLKGNAGVENELHIFRHQIAVLFKPYDFMHSPLLQDMSSNKYRVKTIVTKLFPGFDVSLIDECMPWDGQVRIFALAKYLLSYESVFDTKMLAVFNNIFKNNTVKSLSDSEMGRVLLISKTQATALKEKLFKKKIKIFNFIAQFDINLEKQYGLNPDSDYFCLTDEEMVKINKIENTNYKKQFAHILFHFCIEKRYDLIGFGSESAISGWSSDPNLWWSNYLVRKELSDKFHFEQMLEDMRNNLSKRVRPDQRMDINYEVLDYFIVYKKAIHQRVVHVCRKLLHDETIMNYDEGSVERLHPANSMDPLEAVKEILGETRVPLVYQLLHTKLKNRYPNLHISEHELREMVEQSSDIYYGGHHIGYGIKKWSKATEILKNGLLSETAIEILRYQREPITINSLLRRLSWHNVLMNYTTALADLKAEKNKSIVFYKGGYVGLRKNPVEQADDDVDDDEEGELPVFPLGKWDD